jgi:pyridoxamine 5'-phosphate oxidase
MNKHISHIRTEYMLKELDESMVAASPFVFFHKWFEEALESKVPEPNAMCLSTASPEGMPSSRIVLLKGADDRGFSFYTNYHSTKGRMIEANSNVCLNFFWPDLERQVRIEGKAEKLSPPDSDAYFASRPRGSQLGAWVSNQSEEVPGRKHLEELLLTAEKNFEGVEVPRPAHWGGFIVVPVRIEFWQGRENRLHDRILYKKLDTGSWGISRLAP